MRHISGCFLACVRVWVGVCVTTGRRDFHGNDATAVQAVLPCLLTHAGYPSKRPAAVRKPKCKGGVLGDKGGHPHGYT